MNKTLLIAGALLLATSASSAFAQGYNPYYGGQSYYGRQGSYGDYVRQLREEQRHARVHEELDAAHADEHYQGLESRGDHRDLHDAIDEAHDAYHYTHPRAGLPPSYPYGMNGGYGYGGGYSGYGGGYSGSDYGYRSNNYYGNSGMSFRFGFGR
jgi:hypothetical protein